MRGPHCENMKYENKNVDVDIIDCYVHKYSYTLYVYRTFLFRRRMCFLQLDYERRKRIYSLLCAIYWEKKILL